MSVGLCVRVFVCVSTCTLVYVRFILGAEGGGEDTSRNLGR